MPKLTHTEILAMAARLEQPIFKELALLPLQDSIEVLTALITRFASVCLLRLSAVDENEAKRHLNHVLDLIVLNYEKVIGKKP